MALCILGKSVSTSINTYTKDWETFKTEKLDKVIASSFSDKMSGALNKMKKSYYGSKIKQCLNRFKIFEELDPNDFNSKKQYLGSLSDFKRKSIDPVKQYVMGYHRTLTKVRKEKDEKHDARTSVEDILKEKKGQKKSRFKLTKKIPWKERRKMIGDGLAAIEKIYNPKKEEDPNSLVGRILADFKEKYGDKGKKIPDN